MMDHDITENIGCCSDGSCGCHFDTYATTRECPRCGKHLRLTGRAQRLEYRLACPNCGYTSVLLSPQEVGELI
jgi:ribosomal protein S27AE